MKTLVELRKQREDLIRPGYVQSLGKRERRQETAKLRLIDKAIQFLLCEPSEDFINRQLAFIEKKMEAVRKQANEAVKRASSYSTASTAQKIRARVYKEEGMSKLREQKYYVEYILS